jgi:hypothetical protein
MRGGLFVPAMASASSELPPGSIHDGIVDIAINGSYLAYVYVGLLQISIVYLQRPD